MAGMEQGGGLAGRHALVTGGSRGIGLAIAQALLAEGASVTLVGRSRAALDQALQGMDPARCAAVAADVTSRAEVEQAVADAALRFGAIHILVNNAGSVPSAEFADIDDAQWHQMLVTGTCVTVDGGVTRGI